MRRRAAAAAALLLCISPSWIFLSNTPLAEITATAAYVLVLAGSRGVLRSPGGALLCAAATLLAWLTRPQLAALLVAVLAAALLELGPRRAVRSVPLWTYALGVVSGMAAIGFLVDSATGESIYAHRVSALAVSPDGKRLAAGTGPEGDVYVWNLEREDKAQLLKHGGGTIAIVAFSPDSTKLASVGWGILKVWPLEAAKQ